MKIPLCDMCKRKLEQIHAQLEDRIALTSMIFHGKYMQGSDCTKYNHPLLNKDERHGTNFCIQYLIEQLAKSEEKE